MNFVLHALDLVRILILVDVVLSWILPASKFPRSLTDKVTGPLYAPLRKLVPPERTGGLDLSPLLVLVGIEVVSRLLRGGGLF